MVEASRQSRNVTHTYQDDLDNEDIILAIENTPTYKRTKQMIEDLKSVPEKKEETSSEPIQGVISFRE